MDLARQPDESLSSADLAFSPRRPRPRFAISSSDRRYILSIFLLAAIYFLAARLGLPLASVHTNVSPVWPPTGIAIAAVLLLGYRVWPGILLGAFLANFLTPVPAAISVAIAMGNTVEALCACFLLRSAGFHNSLDRARDVFKFVIAAMLCTMVGATIGTLSLYLGSATEGTGFGSLWLTWWLGDLAGAVTVAPLLLTWGAGSRHWLPKRRYLEAALLLLLLSGSAIVTFGKVTPTPVRYFPLTRLLVPFLLWAAFRLGRRGVTAAIVVVSAFAVWGTAHGAGPFISGTANESLLLLQLYVGSNAVTFLFLGVVVEERRLLEETRRANERRLIANLAVTRILAESPELNDALLRILQTIGETLGWVMGAVWIPDSEANVLRCWRVWHSPSAKVARFEAICHERTFTPGIGLPGRVWTNLSPVWIPDVAKDQNFPRAPSALEEGLHAAFAFPILSSEKFLGVMEFFSHEIREPDETILAMLGSIGNQLGQFIERKRSDKALGQLAAIVEASDDVIIGKDLNGVITTWNPAAERLYGYKAEEALGKPVSILIPLDRPDEEPAILAKLRRGERIDHYETVRMAKDGKRIHVSLTVSPIRNASGVVIGASKIARDISEQKRAQEEREGLLARERAAREEAEIANRTKDEFLAVLSHELRTPLTAMLGWLAILRGHRLDQETTEHAIETIERNAKMQAQLIEDLVDVSRIVGGKLKLEVRPIDLLPVIDAAIEVVRPSADAKGIRIEFDYDSSVGPVSGDPARLQQVIWNVLSNAVKFTPKGGSIHVHFQRAESSAEVVIRDTGVGIPADFLPHVFERFRQADSAVTRSHRGMGLGLAIVRHLIELHGGMVTATSEGENQGSTFTIHLPIAAVSQPGLAPAIEFDKAIPGEEKLNGIRVLLVEDEPDARELIALALTRSGAQVEAVDSAGNALDRLEFFAPDVLLSDIGLPVQSGYDLIRVVRAWPSDLNKIPAIALTAFATENDRQMSVSAGFHAHLAKPVEPNHLIEIIKILVNGKGSSESIDFPE